MRRVCVLVTCLLMLGVVTPMAAGQITSATVVGTVRDSQGAAVPAATVTVTGRGNGVSRTATTDSEGRFTVPNVPPGTVDITVVAQGFAESTRKDVVLEVGQNVTVDLEVGVGAVKETVVVAGRAVVIDSTRSVVDDVISTKAIESLPLNGRNFLELAFLIPGNAPAPELRPDEDQHRHDLLGRSAGSRRQRHDRRRRQQRRRGREGRCRTSPRNRCRSSRSRPTASALRWDAPPRRRSTS